MSIDTLTLDSSTQYLDPNGINRTDELPAIMQAAAQIWEDIIEDTHTIDVTYQWEDLSNDDIAILGLGSPTAQLSVQAGGQKTLIQVGRGPPLTFNR